MAMEEDTREKPEHPWLVLGIAVALFVLLWSAVDAALTAFDRWQERDWAVVRRTVPMRQGRGHLQDGGWSIDLALSPSPVRMMRENTAVVCLTYRDRPVCDADLRLRLRVPAMPMVDVAAILRSRSDGTYVGRVVLPLCSRSRAEWVVQVRVDSEGRQLGGGFAFPAWPPGN